MNIIKTQLNQSKHEPGPQRSKFCASVGFLTLLVFLIFLTAVAEEPKTEEPSSAASDVETQTTGNTAQKVDATEKSSAITETSKEQITGTAERMERYEQEGITILIGNAKTVRSNEQGVEIGFLNADKITLKSDTETDQTVEIIAEGNVEIRDQDIFATCDHAIMNNLTNTVTLKENVVVLQNKDRLETKLFTFNRTTGKQTGEGGVKFKVTVTQAAPVDPETQEDNETGADTGEADTSTPAPEKTEGTTEKETDTQADTSTPAPEKTEGTTEKETGTQNDTEEEPEADTENSEETDSNGDASDTDTETADDVDTDAEPEESETD